jgi:Flp pilus assembly secretin CpaC
MQPKKSHKSVLVMAPIVLFLIGTVCVCRGAALSPAWTDHKFEDHAAELEVIQGRGKVLRAAADIYRVAVVDDSVCDVIQVAPNQLSILGKKPGVTTLTVWVKDSPTRAFHILVRVKARASGT